MCEEIATRRPRSTRLLTMELLFRQFFDAQSKEGAEAVLNASCAGCLMQTGQDRRGIGEAAVHEPCALLRSRSSRRMPRHAKPLWTIGLLTGGQDRHYAVGLGMALMAQDLALEVIGSDEIDGPEFQGNPRCAVSQSARWPAGRESGAKNQQNSYLLRAIVSIRLDRKAEDISYPLE